jgi:hypothetical protein
MTSTRMLVFLAPLVVAAVASAGGRLPSVVGVPRDGTPSQTRNQVPPTSYALIDSALAGGRIGVETAYRYRVFAAFGDTRLPAAYRGDDHEIDEFPAAARDAGRMMKTFSSATQAELQPFFVPPATPGSWLELSTVGSEQDSSDAAPSPAESTDGMAAPAAGDGGGRGVDAVADSHGQQAIQWHAVDAVGGKVRVWAQMRHAGDSLKAEQIATAVTSTIWPRLTKLFWEPLPDGNLSNNGGGPALDIYLIHPGGYTGAGSPARGPEWKGSANYSDLDHVCGESPRYLLINSARPVGGPTSIGIVQTVAHELTHAITAKVKWLNEDCREYYWFEEATGQWSEDWVYPKAQSEQLAAWRFMQDPRKTLDDTLDLHQYGAYLFPYYLVSQGKQLAVPEMWKQFGTHKSLAGIDAALRLEGTSIEEEFPKFAVANWNRPPADDYMKDDALKDVANVGSDSINATVPPGGHFERSLFMGMYYLSTEYIYFLFDKTVQSVTFENTLTPIPFAGVWGIEKIKGQWKKPADWTQDRAKSWCRNAATEDLEALVLVFTNKQWKDKQLRVDPGPNRPVVKAYPTGCNAWVGTVTATFTNPNLEDLGTWSETATSTVRFEPDPEFAEPGEPVQYWMAVSGEVKWTASLSGGKCTGNFSGTVPLLPGYPGGSRQAILRITDDGGNGLRYTASLGPWPDNLQPLLTWSCPNGQKLNSPLLGVTLWWGTDPAGHPPSPDGKTLSDTWQTSLGNATIKWTWTFRFQS